MTTIQTIDNGDSGLIARSKINDNNTNLNNDKLETSLKGASNGLAELDSGGKVPTSQLPNIVQGAIRVIGTWNATTNSPNLSALTLAQGESYQVSVAGSTSLNGETNWKVKDLVVWDDSLAGNYFKIDNTDDVISVSGKTGIVSLDKSDVGLSNVDNTSDANKPVSTAQQTALNLKANLETGGYGVALNTDYYVGAPSSSKTNFRAGYLALNSYVSGDYMIAIGESALKDAVSNSSCTALGPYALEHCISNRNTGVGPFAGRNITTGSENIVIGAFSATSITTASNNVIIGDGLDCPNTNGNIRIGTNGISRVSFNGTEWDFAQRFKEVKFAANYVNPSTDNAITFFQRPTLGSVLGYTPTVYGGTVAGTATYSQQEAYVWAINNVFFFKIRLVWSGHTGTGSLNLPLPITSITEQTTGVVYSNLITGVPTNMVNQMYIAKNTNFIQFFGELLGGGAGSTTTIAPSGQLAIDGSIIY